MTTWTEVEKKPVVRNETAGKGGNGATQWTEFAAALNQTSATTQAEERLVESETAAAMQTSSLSEASVLLSLQSFLTRPDPLHPEARLPPVSLTDSQGSFIY